MPKDPLDDLERALSNPGAILAAASSSLAEECIGLIKDGFRTETDPYGRKWAPKQRPDGRKVLSGKTGRLKGGWKVSKQDQHEVAVTPSVDYAEHHQNPRRNAQGRLKRPKRMMVPEYERGLPLRWKRQLREAANDAIAEFFNGHEAGLRQLGRLTLVGRVGFKVG